MRPHTITSLEIVDILNISVPALCMWMKIHHIRSEFNNGRKIISPGSVRSVFEKRNFKYPHKILAFQIVKGGVGKTSLSYSLAVRASRYGAKVLVIDMDQQANLTTSLGIDPIDKLVWLDIHKGLCKIEDAIIKIDDFLHVIPSNLSNSALDAALFTPSTNLKSCVRDKLNQIKDQYELIILDCAPAINRTNTAITNASDLIIIPINPDPYAIDGLKFTMSEMAEIKKNFKSSFDFRVVWNKYDARESIGVDLMHKLAQNKQLVNKILPVVCRVDAQLRKAALDKVSIFNLPRKSSIREDIDHFTREILGLNAWKQKNKAAKG